jgi:hypothetical protein
LRDDYEVPYSVGLAGSFLVNRFEDLSARNTDTLIHVRNFDQIADLLLADRRKPVLGKTGSTSRA